MRLTRLPALSPPLPDLRAIEAEATEAVTEEVAIHAITTRRN